MTVVTLSSEQMQKQNGFSIIEIIIVLVIATILVLVITPAYQNYIVRSNRSDAIKSLMALQISEEKWRINNTTYTSTLSNVWSGTASIEGYYTMAITSASVAAYTLTATAGTAQTSDTGCTTLTLTYANGTTTKSPTGCWQ